VISGLKLTKTITLKQILFKAKKILNKIQYPNERKKETKTPQTQPKNERVETERVEKEERNHRHKTGAHESKVQVRRRRRRRRRGEGSPDANGLFFLRPNAKTKS
jgi:hypothetical protein